MKLHLSLRKPSVSAGYALPLIIVLSGAFLVIGLSVLQAVTSLRVTLDDQYKTSLAREAGEAGIAYAKSCLQKTNYVAGWTATSPLMQNTDCSGTVKNGGTLAFLPDKVLNNNRVRTSFTVGALVNQDEVSQTIQATGYVDVYKDGGWVNQVYKQDFQQRVKRTNYGDDTFTFRGAGACSIRNNKVECRGLNQVGQVGLGYGSNDYKTNTQINMTNIPANAKALKVEGGIWQVCAIIGNKLYCWGYNQAGQLGDGTLTDNGMPKQVVFAGDASKVVTDIVGYGDTNCAIVKDNATSRGRIYCWGDNKFSQTGTNTVGYGANPTQGTPYIFGCGTWWYPPCQNVQDASNAVRTPQEVVGLPAAYDAQSMATSGGGAISTCAIVNTDIDTKNRRGYCWGNNLYGQNGNGASNTNNATAQAIGAPLTNKSLLTITSDGLAVPQVANTVTSGHTCAITSDDLKLYCWGSNRFGELGRASHENGTHDDCGYLTLCFAAHPLPLAVDGSDQIDPNIGSPALRNTSVTDVVGGIYHMCAIVNGAPYCWGSNDCGQLGTGWNNGCSTTAAPGYTSYAAAGAVDVAQRVNTTAPQFIGSRFSSLAGAGWTACMVAGTNNVACWGRNDSYEQSIQNPNGSYSNVNTTLPTISTDIKPLFPDYTY